MQAVLFIGIPASGKSTLFRARFVDTHVRLNLDMLRTRRREAILLDACLRAKQPFVIDNTNPTPEERARYIQPAKAAGFEVIGYYFQSKVADALLRNERRGSPVPERAVKATYSRMVLPRREEGFDRLYYVRVADVAGEFAIEEWNDEV